MMLLLTTSSSVYSSFKTHENLEISSTSVIEAIRHAQANAESGRDDSAWGVKLQPTSVTVFKGSSYATRDTSRDQALDLSGGVALSGLSEIVFSKIIGSTSNTGTVTIVNSYGTRNISINEKGTLTY